MKTARDQQAQTLAQQLTPSVLDLVVQSQVRRFRIGRTSNLRRRANNQRCDGIITLYSDIGNRRLVEELEYELAIRFGQHPKYAIEDEPLSQESEFGSKHVYVAVWYREAGQAA